MKINFDSCKINITTCKINQSILIRSGLHTIASKTALSWAYLGEGASLGAPNPPSTPSHLCKPFFWVNNRQYLNDDTYVVDMGLSALLTRAHWYGSKTRHRGRHDNPVSTLCSTQCDTSPSFSDSYNEAIFSIKVGCNSLIIELNKFPHFWRDVKKKTSGRLFLKEISFTCAHFQKKTVLM